MGKHKYVLLDEKDFKEKSDSYGRKIFECTSREPYIEIPHTLFGYIVSNCDRMFYHNNTLRGIKSTSKVIDSVSSMFDESQLMSLDLTEFNFEGVKDFSYMFNTAVITKVIFPTNQIIKPRDTECMFLRFTTGTLDLSAFDFSENLKSNYIFLLSDIEDIIFPKKSVSELIAAHDCYESILEYIPTKSQTEELCWVATLNNKSEGIHVKIKSKRILMYLGDECPEYIKFYYDKEN